MDYTSLALDKIKNQFLAIMSGDADFYADYNIILSNEQQYVKAKNRDPKNIYIVVKFLSATVNFGQIVLPITINAVAEENKIEVCQKLLLEYAQQYTLDYSVIQPTEADTNTYIVKQVYESPQSMANFNNVYAGFRSLFYMSGTFLIGTNSNPISEVKYYTKPSDSSEVGENIDFININWQWAQQLDSQAFYNTNSRTVSKVKMGTLGVSMSIYLSNSVLCNKVLGIAFNKSSIVSGKDSNQQDITVSNNGIKECFYLSLKFANGTTIDKMCFRLVSANAVQNLGELPLISISFTN